MLSHVPLLPVFMFFSSRRHFGLKYMYTIEILDNLDTKSQLKLLVDIIISITKYILLRIICYLLSFTNKIICIKQACKIQF